MFICDYFKLAPFKFALISQTQNSKNKAHTKVKGFTEYYLLLGDINTI